MSSVSVHKLGNCTEQNSLYSFHRLNGFKNAQHSKTSPVKQKDAN